MSFIFILLSSDLPWQAEFLKCKGSNYVCSGFKLIAELLPLHCLQHSNPASQGRSLCWKLVWAVISLLFPIFVWGTTLYICKSVVPFWVGIFITLTKKTAKLSVWCRHAQSDCQSTAAFLYVIGKFNIMLTWKYTIVTLKENTISNFTLHIS